MTSIKNYQRHILLFKVIMLIVFTAISILLIYFTISSAKSSNHKKLSPSSSSEVKQFKGKKFNLEIDNAVFTGRDESNTPYKILSETANKIADNTYRLNEVDAFYKTKKNDKTNEIPFKIHSQSATLNTNNKHLKLQDKILLDYNELKLYCSEMTINLNNKSASSIKPVRGVYNSSYIESDSLTSASEGEEVNFNGNVFTCINLDDASSD